MHLENPDKYMEDHFEDSEKARETARSKKTTEPGVVSWIFFFFFSSDIPQPSLSVQSARNWEESIGMNRERLQNILVQAQGVRNCK